MIGCKLKKVKSIRASDYSWSLKLIDGEIWSCQSDGISVNNTTLAPVRHIKTGSTKYVALLPGANVVIAGLNLCEMSKSGTERHSLKTCNTVQ